MVIRDFQIEITKSSVSEDKFTFRTWCKNYEGADDKIEATIYDMNHEELLSMYNVLVSAIGNTSKKS